jgi:RimJ/RimL family protein N-acetyltransferase
LEIISAMDQRIILSSEEAPGVELKSIGAEDLENLRAWKNEHREFFFFKGIISETDQLKWYEQYLRRPDDFMFVILVEHSPIGCIGFRYTEGKVDIYNVILGAKEMGGRGLMSGALRIMCSYAAELYRGVQGLKVLRHNPAVGWYKQNGFREIAAFEEHLELELDEERFKFCPVRVDQLM